MALSSLVAPLLAGCTTPSGAPDNTGTGALVGGLSGAALGAAIDRRHPGAGALLGAAAGAITGGLIGHSIDEQQARAPVYYVAVPAAPPPATVEGITPAPGPGYVWISGHWVWTGSTWAWQSGYWALPPTPQAVWVPAGWVHGPYGWYWQQGYWR